MNLDDFLEAIKDKLGEYYGDECKVTINTVTKNNGNLKHGVTILRKGSTSAPNIYVDDAYEEYKNGKSMEKVTTELICLRNRCKDEIDFDADSFCDYEWVRERLGIKLVSRERNSKLLSDVPYKCFSDLAILFNVDVTDDEIGKGTILIRNEHMSMWNISLDRLYEDALSSMVRRDPPYMADMVDLVIEMLEQRTGTDGYQGIDADTIRRQMNDDNDDGNRMYILTDQSKINGASVIVYPGMLADIGRTLGSDYFVLPSSIHEVIILPADPDEDRGSELSGLVREINETKLSPDEVLSDHAYRYHRTTNWLEPVAEQKTAEYSYEYGA